MSAGTSDVQLDREVPALPAPRRAPMLLAVALPVAVVLEVLALDEAFGGFPIFDVTPVFILVVALVSRRRAGATQGWMTGSAIFAAVLVVEWIGWVGWLWFGVLGAPTPMTGERILARMVALWPALVIQGAVLLVLFGFAAVRSCAGTAKNRRPVPLTDEPAL